MSSSSSSSSSSSLSTSPPSPTGSEAAEAAGASRSRPDMPSALAPLPTASANRATPPPDPSDRAAIEAEADEVLDNLNEYQRLTRFGLETRASDFFRGKLQRYKDSYDVVMTYLEALHGEGRHWTLVDWTTNELEGDEDGEEEITFSDEQELWIVARDQVAELNIPPTSLEVLEPRVGTAICALASGLASAPGSMTCDDTTKLIIFFHLDRTPHRAVEILGLLQTQIPLFERQMRHAVGPWFARFRALNPMALYEVVAWAGQREHASKLELLRLVYGFVVGERAAQPAEKFAQAQMLAAMAFFEYPIRYRRGRVGTRERWDEETLSEAITTRMRELDRFLPTVFPDYVGSGLQKRYERAVPHEAVRIALSRAPVPVPVMPPSSAWRPADESEGVEVGVHMAEVANE